MRILLAALLFVLSFAARAYTPELSSLPAVAQLRLDLNTVKAAVAAAKGRPLEFAVGAELGATEASGSWDEPEAGLARWRLRVASTAARALSFHFEALSLPAHAELYLYTDGGADVQGPYTAADNGSFWSPLVRSEDAVIEARMPAGERAQFSLRLAQVFHAFRDFGSVDASAISGPSGDSGACEIDVACPAGNAYRDQIRATVLLTIVSGLTEYYCSGSLVNNSAQDGRALILTANHCGVRDGNVTATRAYFNVQRSACSSGTVGTVTQNIAGKTVLARTSGTTVSDYTLFELASEPPASYDVYYAGWDAGSTAPRSGALVHHPAGDDKKVSLYTQAASAASSVCIAESGGAIGCTGGFRVDAWEVSWAQGTTEPGSSGSGLLDQNKRIVGTLSGGGGACSGTSNNGEPDYFARLDRAWNAASATGTTLGEALDPAGKGYTALDGRDAGAADGDGSSGGGSFGLALLPLALAALSRRLTSRRACPA